MNLFNDAVSPIPSPNESILLRYFRPSDLDFSPSPSRNRSIGNYHKSSSTRSSCGSNKSPLSVVKNFEDDVLVMDGILVDSNKASKSSGKFRSSSSTLSDSSSNSGNNNFNFSSNSGSNNLFKTEICKTWENTGGCRYGYKCQFAHGKEELRPNPNRVRPQKKLDLIIDPYYSPQSSPSSGSSKHARGTMLTPSSAKEATISKFNKASPIQLKDSPAVDRNLTSPDWSPIDDGILVQLPSAHGNPPRKAVDVYIDNLLYGCAEKKRLPVFVDICPK